MSWLSLEVRSAQWTFGANALHDVLCQCLVGAQPGAPATAESCYAGQAEAIIFHRKVSGGMRPVLEDLALRALCPVELRRVICRQARPEHVVMRPFNHGNRIDLDISQASHDLWYRV